LEAFLNVNINVLSKTLILKMKYIYLFYFQKLITLFISKQFFFKVSMTFNKHELLHEHLLSFVDFLFTFYHMTQHVPCSFPFLHVVFLCDFFWIPINLTLIHA
jgi:hypothetical protein